MNRSLSYAHAIAVATEGVFTLGMALDGGHPLEWYRGHLGKLLRHLNFVVWVFQETGAGANYPEFYLPIADAHISLREALQGHFIDRDGLLCASAYLGNVIDLKPGKGGRRDAA